MVLLICINYGVICTANWVILPQVKNVLSAYNKTLHEICYLFMGYVFITTDCILMTIGLIWICRSLSN